MSTYFFAGHESLTNRGCEALLRGITRIVREVEPDAEFRIPSFNAPADAGRWSAAAQLGVKFVPAYRMPPSTRLWARAQERVPQLRRLWWPQPGLPGETLSASGRVDICVMTGGDVLSLDYGVPSLTRYLGQARHFQKRGVPVVLWAGSVGPFHLPDVEREVMSCLRGFADLSVRESATLAYLQGHGLRNVRQVADPAFVLDPEVWDTSAVLPSDRDSGVLGFNVSPLVHKLARQQGPAAAQAFESALMGFLQAVLDRTSISILLIPHVDSIDGSANNSDHVYMASLLARARWPGERVVLAPREMNAARVKHLIAQCQWFIGARTHATIAAWSSLVPTLSLGYSVKARGLNRDLFDSEEWVEDTAKLSTPTLWRKFMQLQEAQAEVKSALAARMPTWRARAREAMPRALQGSGQ